MSRASRRRPRIGLALAGGGPLGGIYEIGALYALEEALAGVDLQNADIYVGVSSGAFIAAALANGISAAELYTIFIENASAQYPVSPQLFRWPAAGEYVSRALRLPELLWEALRSYAGHPTDSGILEPLSAFGRAIPAGVFDSAPIEGFLQALFTAPGRSNDFRRLPRRLRIIATELDTGATVKFGLPPHDAVPISRAVQASVALPGLFPPVRIADHDYVDGALKKTLHASVALEEGAKLVLCINPLVPFDASLAARAGHPQRRKLIEGGLPVVLSQTFRALIHSRLEVGMSKYEHQFPGADVVLLEPDRSDASMFYTNVFSYADRHRVCAHAYQRTRADLLARSRTLAPVLRRHGIALRMDVLRDRARQLPGRRHGDAPRSPAAVALAQALDRLQSWVRTVSHG
ncbi:MAG: patatin-like phospholipase family protein [Burkholderiales bacterium]|nr:patatin-like phospholipase family protein [Burkholderiales bacterium]